MIIVYRCSKNTSCDDSGYFWMFGSSDSAISGPNPLQYIERQDKVLGTGMSGSVQLVASSVPSRVVPQTIYSLDG